MKPACHNRAPFGPGYWAKTSTIAMGKRRPSVFGLGLPVYRWIEHRFDDVCGTWLGTNVGPQGEPYPQAQGWDCKGCRLDPHIVIHSDLKPYNETIEIDQLRGNGYMRNQHGVPMAKMRVVTQQSRQAGRTAMAKLLNPDVSTKPWSISVEVAKNIERMVPREKVTTYPHTDDVPPGWNAYVAELLASDGDSSIRKIVERNAIEYYKRTGRPVRIMCGDVEVGHVP